jgi:Flp pilus assembly protein TadG
MLGSRSGQAAVVLAVSITLLCGMIGLVVDLGWAYFKRESVQAAAESAVLAAASFARSNGSTCGTSTFSCTASDCASVSSGNEMYVGCEYAQQNGYTDGSHNQHVSVTAGTGAPPTTPGATATSFYVTATVSESVPVTFSRVLNGGSALSVAARATAVVPYGKSPYCIYALATSGSGVQMSNGSLTTACGIWINSSASNALQLANGASVTVTGGEKVHIHGGWNNNGTVTPAPDTGAAAASDPYSTLSSNIPATGSCQAMPGGGDATIGPGTYCSQIKISGNNNLTMTPGVYVLQNGLQFTSGGTLTAHNVFLYVPSGSVSMSTGTFDISAPTSGTYAGVALYQNASDTSGISLTGNAALTLTGVFYAPGAQITFTGGSGSVSTGMTLVASSFKFSGSSYVNDRALSRFTSGAPGLVD